MKLKKILRTAWDGLMLNKVRSFLTTLGVIIGVASVIIMLAVSAGTEAAIAEQINALGANLIIVSPMRGVPGAARTMLLGDAESIADQVVGIEGVSAEQAPPAVDVKANGVSLESISAIGTTTDFPSVRDYEIASGRYFTTDEDEREAKVAVLGAGIANDLFGGEDPLGQSITIGTTKLTVIGVMTSKGMVADVDYDGRIYLPIHLVFEKYMPSMSPTRDRVRTIYVKAESQEAIPSIINQINALLSLRHDVDPTQPDFSVQTQQDIIATQEATTAAFLRPAGLGRWRFVNRWGDRYYEHHAGLSYRANTRDRSTPGIGRPPCGCPAPVPAGGDYPQPGWRPGGRRCWRWRLLSFQLTGRHANCHRTGLNSPGFWRCSGGWHLLRLLSCAAGCPPGSHRGSATESSRAII